MARRLVALDCTRCGACCTNPDENRAEGYIDYVEVLDRDALLGEPELVQRFVRYDRDGRPHLRLDPGGRCLALRGRVGRRVSCSIYDRRPTACRKVESGSDRCLAHRRERGL